MLPDPGADKAEAEFRPVGDEYHVVAGLEVLLASVGRRETDIDTLVNATENTMCDYVFHVLHNTPIGGV
jgi:hypothetical protein